MAGDAHNVGDIDVPDPLAGLTTAAGKQADAIGRVNDALRFNGAEYLRLEAGAVAQSQHIRFRVLYLIISRATAGDAVLTIGTQTFTFTVGGFPVRIDLPLVIERGVDIEFDGDGRAYLVGYPE